MLGVFAWALLGFGSIYYAMAQRALDLAVEAVKEKASLSLSRSMAYHPEVEPDLAEGFDRSYRGIGPRVS